MRVEYYFVQYIRLIEKEREEGMKGLKKLRNLIPVGCIGLIYLLAFFMLENRKVPVHIIQGKIDTMIPFCEYFIIPYFLWFAYVTVTVIYFACFNDKKEEYTKLCVSLLTGMIVFLIISYIYPNGHNLRPALTGENLFQKMVMNLYETDTSTNILPSLHVFYSVVCCIALVKNERIKKNKVITLFTYLLTISIVLSTMFLKQHSIIDVVMALLMNGVCFQLFYNEAYAIWNRHTVPVKTHHKRKGIQP